MVKFQNIRDKGKIIKTSKKKDQITYKAIEIRILSDFSTAALNT